MRCFGKFLIIFVNNGNLFLSLNDMIYKGITFSVSHFKIYFERIHFEIFQVLFTLIITSLCLIDRKPLQALYIFISKGGIYYERNFWN